MIMTATQFDWFCSAIVGGVCLFWFFYDILLLRRTLPKGAAARDEIFGGFVGLTIASFGIFGTLMHHLSE